MGTLTRWLRQPQRVWLRRAVFQLHLWTGLAIGLYVVALSLTGSVLVYRIELFGYLGSPRAVLNEQATPLTADQIRAAAERAYPGWTITSVSEGRYRAGGQGRNAGRPPDPTASVMLKRGDETKHRLFDPYGGRDLGDGITQGQRFILWLTRLHDTLLLDRPNGVWWNGVLSLVFTGLVLSGFVVWWPGLRRWRRSLRVNVTGGWRRFNWDLHSALGIWLFLFMLLWGLSGWYLGIPEPLTEFAEFVDRVTDPDGVYGERFGDIALAWLARLHFGRWRNPGWGPWLQAVWAVVGIVPAIMFVTGTLMWWNRVVRRRRPGRDVAGEPA